MNGKIKVSIVTLLAAVLLAGCGNKNDSTKSSSDNQTTAKSVKTPKSDNISKNFSFKNGTYNNKNTKIKIIKTQVGRDNRVEKDGVIITFDITNKSKKEFTPHEAMNYLKVNQSNGKSDFELDADFDVAQALYPTFLADGTSLSDDEENEANMDKYDAQTDKQNKFNEEYSDPQSAKIVSGKTVRVVYGYTLKDKTHPVYVKGYDSTAGGKLIGSPYKINLNK